MSGGAEGIHRSTPLHVVGRLAGPGRGDSSARGRPARNVRGLVQSGVDDDGEAGIVCWRCDHPGATTEEYLTYLAETLERDRWVVQYVVSDHQPSAYTVGLHDLGLP